jgi:hypothetical protein
MPDWIGDQMAGVRPEATPVFDRNAQIADVPRRSGKAVKSTLCSRTESSEGPWGLSARSVDNLRESA